MTVGYPVKLSGKEKRGSAFLATELSSIGGGNRERMKLRGRLESIDVPGKAVTILGLPLALTHATQIEDRGGKAVTARELAVSKPAVVYAIPSRDEGAWTATKIRLTDRLGPKWEVEGPIRNRHQPQPGLDILDVGPLTVTVDHYTNVVDVKHRATRVVPFNPRTWQDSRKELIWFHLDKLDPTSGFGTAARNLLLALERSDIDITMAPTRSNAPLGFERFYKPFRNWDKLGFYYHWSFHPSVLKCQHVINCSLWDTARIPDEHVDEINAVVTLQYVPCKQNLESFRECGVRVPVKVLNYGVDPELFPQLDRTSSAHFTFGTFGDLSPRKGIDVLIRAFRDEFRLREPVRLLMKSTSPVDAYAIDDPRITVRAGRLSHDALLELLREMDAFVLPSRGEGFGLCGLEAMSTGLPLIATNWSGPAEYLDARDSFPLSYRLVEANGTRAHSVNYFGLWAEPNYEHLRYLMRCVYERREEATAKGRAAAARVHEDWTWDRAARQVVQDLDALVSA